MEGEQRSKAELLLEIEKLRRELEGVKREKADLEIVLETTTAHSDLIEALLQESNQQLRAEISERQRAETALQAAQTELKSLLAVLSRDKADLEILLEMATAHGDIIGDWLHNLSIRDPLTSLFNRRYMDEYLTRELLHAEQQQKPLAIMMIDIDHFKHFNDTFGHKAGDLVLRKVSRFLQTQQRHKDVVCRYGGEELLIVLPETDVVEAHKRAEQMRDGVKQFQLTYLHRPLDAISISIGIACFPEHGRRSSELIQAADAALYCAKAAGRDRVVTAEC